MRTTKTMLVLASLTLFPGCASMEGKWSLANVDPTAARRDFAFDSITLQNDGTFYAEANEHGDTDSVSGVWKLKDGVLSLREQDGERHTYDAELEAGGKRLKLVRHWDGRRMTAVLQKKAS